MADLRFEDKNNQKKTGSTFASGILTTAVAMDDTLFTLPAGSLVTNVVVYVETISGVATHSVDVKVGATVVGNEMITGVAGIGAGTVVPTYFPTGGSVTVVTGAGSLDTAGRIKVIVEYVETELTSGEYTD